MPVRASWLRLGPNEDGSRSCCARPFWTVVRPAMVAACHSLKRAADAPHPLSSSHDLHNKTNHEGWTTTLPSSTARPLRRRPRSRVSRLETPSRGLAGDPASLFFRSRAPAASRHNTQHHTHTTTQARRSHPLRRRRQQESSPSLTTCTGRCTAATAERRRQGRDCRASARRRLQPQEEEEGATLLRLPNSTISTNSSAPPTMRRCRSRPRSLCIAWPEARARQASARCQGRFWAALQR